MASRIIRREWNKSRLLEECEKIHGREKFSYVRVIEADVKSIWSLIPIICTFCRQEWQERIIAHLKRDKCHNQDCTGVKGTIGKYTLELFLERGWQVHGDKFDYSEVKAEHITSNTSKIIITHKLCGYKWDVTICSHITSKRGCPECAGNIKYTLVRFLERAKKVHEDKFDYSKITKEHIHGKKSLIPITCNKCGYQWSPTLCSHINGKRGCMNCVGHVPWTVERLIIRGNEIHGNKYDYSEVKAEHIQRAKSKIPVTCKLCKYKWFPTIADHINSQSGCPNCVSSKGEEECFNVLKTLSIEFKKEYTIEQLPRKRYDFYFQRNNLSYLLEFDGLQHFEERSHFCKKQSFEERQEMDRIKTKVALEAGYRLIRIDYTQIDKIEEHLEKALSSKDKLYLSTSEMYKYIIF